MKKEYIQKASSRLKQNIKVLVNKPSFIAAISTLRKKWNIPEEGLQTQEELDNWYKKLNNDTENYFQTLWPIKRQEIVDLQSKGNLADRKLIQYEFNNLAPRNAFLRDIQILTRDQKLSPRWVNGIKRYLLLNDPNNMGMFVGSVISTKIDMELDTEVISLEIEAETTLEDVKAIWPEVKEVQANLPYKRLKKFQPLRKFDRNKQAFELHKQGKKYREIADELSTDEKTVTEEDVSKMIERYKKKVDINRA